jgi:chemotaxis protein MotD
VATAQTNPQPKPAEPSKGARPDKNPDKDPDKDKDDNAVQADKDAADNKQIAMVEQQLPDQQVLPPAVQASAPLPADIDTDAQTDIKIDGAAPTANAAASSPGIDVPQSVPVDAPTEPGEIVQAQAAPQASAQPVDVETDEAETTVAAASVAAQAVPADAKAPVTARDANKPVKTAAKSEAASTVKPEAANVEQAKDELTQSVKASNEPVRSDEAKPAKTDIAKADTADGESLKGHMAHNSVADNAKPVAPDSQKTDAPQADVRPAETDNAAAPAAAKPAPQSASQSNAAFAINTIAAPQAAQHSQAPIATQHVQVTVQPAPNVPALAVEIAAKSQSGAKQFDIRLDPPELGRVEVRLSIDATGKASAHLSADQPQTLHLLQKDAPILTRALREAGLDVSQDGLNFSLRQQTSGQNGNDGNNGRFGGSRAFSLAASTSIDPTAAVIAYQGLADGRVDIRV